jgi:nitrobenzene nitroreductase
MGPAVARRWRFRYNLDGGRDKEVAQVSNAIARALADRRSIRGYTSQPVSDDLVREILSEARWAPSATNTQTACVYVLTGDALEGFKADLRANAEANTPEDSDLGPRVPLPPLFQARQDEFFKTRASFIAAEEARLGVVAETPPVSPMVAAAGLWGAPVLLVLAIPRDIGLPYGCFDAGAFAQSIALAAHARGLGTCISGSNVRYPDILRRQIPDTEDKLFVIAITLGYPDWDAPLNHFPRTRLDVDEYATFVR